MPPGPPLAWPCRPRILRDLQGGRDGARACALAPVVCAYASAPTSSDASTASTSIEGRKFAILSKMDCITIVRAGSFVRSLPFRFSVTLLYKFQRVGLLNSGWRGALNSCVTGNTSRAGSALASASCTASSHA